MYAVVENLALNADQRATLETALRAMGRHDDPRPINNNHWRRRLDGDAALYHGDFQEADWGVTEMKQRLGNIFGVSWVTIGSATASLSYSEGGTTLAITFSRSGVDYLRVLLLGNRSATQAQGCAEALGYLKANAEAWGEA